MEEKHDVATNNENGDGASVMKTRREKPTYDDDAHKQAYNNEMVRGRHFRCIDCDEHSHRTYDYRNCQSFRAHFMSPVHKNIKAHLKGAGKVSKNLIRACWTLDVP